MKRKILITFFIISLILGFHYTKVFAETNIKETISGRSPNYDITAEHKLEIKDNKDTKITVIFKDMTIIDSYAENNISKKTFILETFLALVVGLLFKEVAIKSQPFIKI